MITGFNTNVSHRGLQFHVQTEDSGRDHPHIISHVYYGGTILASEKSDYADQVEAGNLPTLVRGLMENQHKSMLRRLKRGEFDRVIDERIDGSAADDTSGATDSQPSTEPNLEDAAPRAPAEVPRARGFGDGVGSEKPLDEMILEYLAEKARDRSPSAGDSKRRSRKKG